MGADETPMGCAMNGLIFSMQLDQQGATFTDSETRLIWRSRGVRCVQENVAVDVKAKETAEDLAQRVKDKIAK